MSPVTLFFLWQLFGPHEPIIVSRETTHITAPLFTDGLPNYPLSMLESSRTGVTSENNAAALMWQAMGPGTRDDALSPEEWQSLCEELQIPSAANSPAHLAPLYCRENRRAMARWMYEQGRLKSPHGPPSAAAVREILTSETWPLSHGASALDDVVEEEIGLAMSSPWKSNQYPPLASWLDQHQSQLDLLIAAAQRPKFHSPDPALITGTQDDFLPTSLDSNQRRRDVARLLSVAAMRQIGDGQLDRAWQSTLAIHRWARLARRGSTIVEQLIGFAIEGIASDATLTLLSHPDLSSQLARQIQSDLAALLPAATMADAFAGTERFFALETAVAIPTAGAGSTINELYVQNDHPRALELLDCVAFDWNPLLREINAWNDKFAAAGRLPTRAARIEQCAQLENQLQELNAPLRNPTNWLVAALCRDKRSQMFAAAVAQVWLSPPAMFFAAEDRDNARLDLTRLAAALAVYHTTHGDFPDRLDALVPDVLPQIPNDVFQDRPYLYRRDANGCLLYSIGENGIDDGGSNELYGGGILAGREIGWEEDALSVKLRQQIPDGADDISIRLPRPPFKLPEPTVPDP